MTTFKQFIIEGYKNLFKASDKEKYAEAALAQLRKSYEKVGGIHGNGFSSEQDLIKNIPFWKLRLSSSGDIIAGAYYKDSKGRKRVAISTDGSTEGKKFAADIMISDLLEGRSYVEQSSSSLKFLVKQLGYPELLKHAISLSELKELGLDINKPEPDDVEVKLHPELSKFFYEREIGGAMHTKIAFGKVNKKIF